MIDKCTECGRVWVSYDEGKLCQEEDGKTFVDFYFHCTCDGMLNVPMTEKEATDLGLKYV
jgi:hypothetical protein